MFNEPSAPALRMGFGVYWGGDHLARAQGRAEAVTADV
jgi:hypothetical protein